MFNLYPSVDREFTSNELLGCFDEFRLTQRQLQWWDEQRIVQPQHIQHSRRYTYAEALTVGIILSLKSKGLTMHKVRRVIKFLKSIIAEPSVNLVLIDAKQQPVISFKHDHLLEQAVERPQPLVLISLQSIRDKLDRQKVKR